MKKKTFLVTLFLFLVFINSAMLVVSFITLRERMAAEREKALTEHYVIASALIGDIQAVDGRGGDVGASVGEIIQTYVRYSQNKRNELALSDGEEWIYYHGDNPPESTPASLLKQGNVSERYVFLEKKPVLKLCVYGRFPAPYQEYGLLYCSDFSGTMETWKRMKNMLFTVSAAATFVLALFLAKFLNILFRPLREIAAASRIIAEGNYHTRLREKGGDEVAVMAKQFNRMAEQIETHMKLLQETADKKQQFVDNFAHELRTPLTAIYGYAEYLQKTAADGRERQECTQFILSECGRLQNMAYQLLELAALRDMETEICSVAELFERSCKTMQIKAKEKNIRLSVSVNKEQVAGNRELLLTLLNNLTDNALKAAPEDSVVRISASKQGENLMIEVSDQGIGMTKEQISHIKEAFYRVDKARSRTGGGAGLGLSICDRIVQLHHGELRFISAPGEGTVAQVALPCIGK